MQETRQQILEFLRQHGKATAQELSGKFDLTNVTIRHHLEILRAEGYITDPQVQHCNRPGRPCYIYSLTTMAADLFPSNYCGLAESLLVALECLEPEQRGAVFQAAGRHLVAGRAVLPEELAARLMYIGAYLRKLGFAPRWERDAAGRDQLHIYNCPYEHVASQHPELCQLDEVLLRELTAARVERLSGAAYEGSPCIYQITWPGEE
ncbi:MAG: ArsR family transcriptional regulator [Anaerolineae bacterium]|nr:ArsR family transcriptional regulator [Anaerolineae bacterium]